MCYRNSAEELLAINRISDRICDSDLCFKKKKKEIYTQVLELSTEFI